MIISVGVLPHSARNYKTVKLMDTVSFTAELTIRMGLALSILLYAILALLLLAALAFCVLYASIYYRYWKYSHLPSPKRSSFFLGHFTDYLQLRKETGNDELPFATQFAKWYKQVGGPLFVVHMATMTSVVVTDPDMIKAIAMQPKNDKSHYFTKSASYVFGERFIGRGIFSIPDYETWKPRRRLYDPSFRKSYLQSLLPAFNECVDLFIDKLKPLADGSTQIPMKEHFAEATLDVISKVAFGGDFTQSWSDHKSELQYANSDGKVIFLLENCLTGTMKSLFFPWYKFLHPMEAEGYRKSVRALRAIGRDCIKRRIKMVESGEKAPNDILTHILQVASVQEKVDIEVLVDDFVTYYTAGQETTSNTLSFAIVLILTHPIVLERLQAEVKEVLGTKSTVTNEDLEKLQYTEQVLLETLRMHPPVFLITKQAPSEGLKLGEYAIPGGALLSLQPELLSLNPEHFDDPDTFDPDRFAPENKQPSSFVFFPFGLGHRSCIGRHFALMEAKMILARVIQTFRISLPLNYELVKAMRITTQPRDSVPCTLEPRIN